MSEIPDVDLDVKDREKALALFPESIRASQITRKHDLAIHKTGVYFQKIPVDPITTLAAFPYDVAEALGFFKVDLIPYHIYDMVEDLDDLDDLVEMAESGAFPWGWFLEDRFYDNADPNLTVTQLARHQHLCEMYPPESVEDLAILNALIRPRKKYLVGQDWEVIREKVWQKLPEEDSDEPKNYFFKKSHAVAFALAILVHMQLIDRVLTDGKPVSTFYD